MRKLSGGNAHGKIQKLGIVQRVSYSNEIIENSVNTPYVLEAIEKKLASSTICERVGYTTRQQIGPFGDALRIFCSGGDDHQLGEIKSVGVKGEP